MPRVKPSVKLLQYTSNPEQTVALAAKLCYSDATIDDLGGGLNEENTAKFIKAQRGENYVCMQNPYNTAVPSALCMMSSLPIWCSITGY